MNFFDSTRKNRVAQRINTTAQLASNMLVSADPLAGIPPKIAQVFCSFNAICDSRTKRAEKVINALQAVVGTCEIGLSIALSVSANTCQPVTGLCRMLAVCGYLYEGLLAAHFSLAEINKDNAERSPFASPLSLSADR